MEDLIIPREPPYNVMGVALFQLVVLSMILERALYVVFDVAWWRDRLESSVKSLITMAVSLMVCFHMDFDMLARIIDLSGTATAEGIVVTGLIVSGGSAGAKRLMQDFFKLGRDHRELTKMQLAQNATAIATQ